MARRSAKDETVVDAVQRAVLERRRELLLLSVVFSSAFVCASLAGFHDTDPTWLRPDVTGRGVLNACGPLGANLADILYRIVGYGAWAVVLGLIGPVYALAKRPFLTGWQWALALWLSVMGLGLTELALGPAGEALYRPGGSLGAFVALSLVSVVGRLGAWLVLLAVVVSGVSVLLGVSWYAVASVLVDHVQQRAPVVRESARGASTAAGRLGGQAAGWSWEQVKISAVALWDMLDAMGGAVRRVVGAAVLAVFGWIGLVFGWVRGFFGGGLRDVVVRMRQSLGDGTSPDADEDEQEDWRSLSRMDSLAPSDADIESLAVHTPPPSMEGAMEGDDDRTRVASSGLLTEVAWEPTRAEDPASLLARFPDLGRRAPSARAAGVAAARTELAAQVDFGGRRGRPGVATAASTAPPAVASPAVEPSRAVTAAPPIAASLPESRPAEPRAAEPRVSEPRAAARAPVPISRPAESFFEDDVSTSSDEDDLPPEDSPVVRPTPVARPVAARAAAPIARVMPDEDPMFDDLADDSSEDDSLIGAVVPPPFSVVEMDLHVEKAEGLERRVTDDGSALGDNSLYFELPPLNLLDPVPEQTATIDEDELRELAHTVTVSLASFKVTGRVTNVRVGPVVTTFEFLPDAGISVRRIAVLQDDLAMALCAVSIRVVAPIPGKGVVGIEVPSKQRMTIYLRELLASDEFRSFQGALPVILGKDVEGRPMVGDLAKMPHMLVGGTTGSGKSVGVNGMLMSLLFTKSPEELRLLLVDPKKLEFEAYADVPHLLHPVVTEPKAAAAALAWCCREMDRRYEMLARWGTRNISNFNRKVERESRAWTREKARLYAPRDWPDDVPPPAPELLPYIVIVIDELADLMMVAKKDVEVSVVRLAQMARACGMHLLVATQRPSVDVVTGLIKSNLPTRVSFKLRSVIDSRTILDQGGAEKLLGQGDMLYLPGAGEVQRCHGPFVSDDEVGRVISFLKEQRGPDYIEAITASEGDVEEMADPEEADDLYAEALAVVQKSGKASASMIQRHLKIGYNRAARIIDMMEQAGVVGPADGARPREVLTGHNA